MPEPYVSHYEMAVTLGAAVSDLARDGIQTQDPIRDALLGALVHAVLEVAEKIDHLANVMEGV